MPKHISGFLSKAYRVTTPDDRRHDLTEQMADFLLANGLAAATLRPLAAAAGVSDRMLLYYFKDKANALTAAYDCLLQRLTIALAAHTQPRRLPVGRLRGRVIPLLLADDLWPYMQLWIEMAAMAARGDAVQRDRGEALWRLCCDWIRRQLASDDPQLAARLMMRLQAAVQQKALGLRASSD